MSKFYTTIWWGGLIVCLLFCPVILLAQNAPSLRDIKTSGKYYSGDAYDYDTIKAKDAARNELMSDISKKIQNVNSFNGKSEILVKYIQYLVKRLGDDGYTKVVAFVPVENVTRIIENKELLLVTEIKYTEAQTSSKKERSQIKPTTVSDEKGEVQNTEPDTKNDIVPSVPSTLLARLVACNTSVEIGKILEKEKSSNTLIYSISEAFRKINSSENFYIVLIDPDSKKIMFFFDKGSTERKDLKYGKKAMSIDNDAKNLIQVWIQLF